MRYLPLLYIGKEEGASKLKRHKKCLKPLLAKVLDYLI